jgi:hypothetical protein
MIVKDTFDNISEITTAIERRMRQADFRPFYQIYNSKWTRLLMAQNISQNPGKMICLTLRNMTLLPDMPGLALLIVLIFTPYIELRRDISSTHYFLRIRIRKLQ